MQKGRLICKLVTDSLCKGSVRGETCSENELAGWETCLERGNPHRNGQEVYLLADLLSPLLSFDWSMESWKRCTLTGTFHSYPEKSESRIFFSLPFATRSWGLVLGKHLTGFRHPPHTIYLCLCLKIKILKEYHDFALIKVEKQIIMSHSQ